MTLCSSHFHHIEMWSDFRHYLLNAYYATDTGHTTVNKVTLPHGV